MITLNGTTGITTPDVTTDDLTVDTNTLYVDATNNRVGIGTSSPAVKFQVSGYVLSGGQNYSARFSDAVNSTFSIGHQSGLTNLITDTAMAFYTSSTERMRIDAGGRVTMPYQPAFAVNGNTGTVTVSAGAAVPFNNELYDNGNNFNTSTYTFTAPVAGAYFFNASMYIQGGVSICFYKNGLQYLSPTPLIKSSGTDQYDSSRAMSIVLDLAANDTVAVHSRGIQSSVVFTPHSSFSGFLIG